MIAGGQGDSYADPEIHLGLTFFPFSIEELMHRRATHLWLQR
jgi:hypothetical protein